MDPGQVNSDRNGNSADQKITTDPPAPQTNEAIRHEYIRLSDIIARPPVTPDDHKRQEEARAQILRLQGRKTIRPKARESDPEPAAEVDAQPEPVDSFRQAQETDREYRQAKIVHGNRQRKRRKPARNAVHPWIPGQVQQPQQNHLAKG